MKHLFLCNSKDHLSYDELQIFLFDSLKIKVMLLVLSKKQEEEREKEKKNKDENGKEKKNQAHYEDSTFMMEI